MMNFTDTINCVPANKAAIAALTARIEALEGGN